MVGETISHHSGGVCDRAAAEIWGDELWCSPLGTGWGVAEEPCKLGACLKVRRIMWGWILISLGIFLGTLGTSPVPAQDLAGTSEPPVP